MIKLYYEQLKNNFILWYFRANTVANQYEHMLEEYAEYLETAQGKLKSEILSAVDLNHLKEQSKAHKVIYVHT